MEKVSIEIDARWLRRVRSPVMWTVWALQGVSVSFAPLFLYWAGAGRFSPQACWFVIPLCFAVIFLVAVFYFWLGRDVIRELRK